MDNEQAAPAVQPEEAAPATGAENERETTMAQLLEAMAQAPDEPTPSETGEPVPQPTEAPDTPEPEETEPQPGAESHEAAPEGAEAGARRARNFRGRWDHLDEQERRVVELTTRRGLTLAEACRAVYGEAQNAPAAAEADGTEANAQLAEAIAAQEAELETLKERKAQARGDLEAYDQAAEAYFDARERLRELRTRREQAQEEARSTAARHREEATRQAHDALREEFPEAATPGSDFYEACQEELAYLRESGSPLADDPQVEYKVARRLSRTLGYRRATAPETAAPKRTFRPLPAGGTPIPPPQATMERRIAGAHSPDAMLELMRELGTPFEALLPKA